MFDERWRFDMVLPVRIMMQTQLRKTGRLSIGTELESSNLYFKSDELLNTTRSYEFRELQLKTGITYEYLINRSFVITAKAGLMNIAQSRISEKGEKFNKDKYLVDFDPDALGYFNLGVSLNPF